MKREVIQKLALEQTIVLESQSPLIQNICAIFCICIGSLQTSVFSSASHALG